MKHQYTLNTYFFVHLPEYKIQQKDMARCLGKSAQAFSSAVKNNSFTLFDIDTMGRFGHFSSGSFMKLENGTCYHVAHPSEYKCPVYRLYRLYNDLMEIYGVQENVAKATGISKEKIRQLQMKVNDEEYGFVTPSIVLKKIMYREFLSLLGHIDYVNIGDYIIDENGTFPIGDDMGYGFISAKLHNKMLVEKSEELNNAIMVAEEMKIKYDAACHQHEEDEREKSQLRKSLKGEQKESQNKHNTISGMRADYTRLRTDALALIEFILTIIDKLEELTPNNDVAVFITSIRREVNKFKDKINNY